MPFIRKSTAARKSNRLQRSRRTWPFTISHWSANSGQVMERKRGVLLSMLSALQSRIIRIIKIIKMIVIIGIIKIFSIIGIIETSSKIRRKERGIPFGHLCTDGMVSSGRGHWLLYVLNICKGNKCQPS